MARKTRDPKLIKLLDDQAAAQQEYERWFTRLARAFRRVEKTRQRLKRLRNLAIAPLGRRDGQG